MQMQSLLSVYILSMHADCVLLQHPPDGRESQMVTALWSLQIAASDALIGKIGYGTVSECLAHGRPLVFVRRDYFNEEPFLRRLLQMHGAAVEIRRRDFLEGNWTPFLAAAAELTVSYRSDKFTETYTADQQNCASWYPYELC